MSKPQITITRSRVFRRGITRPFTDLYTVHCPGKFDSSGSANQMRRIAKAWSRETGYEIVEVSPKKLTPTLDASPSTNRPGEAVTRVESGKRPTSDLRGRW